MKDMTHHNLCFMVFSNNTNRGVGHIAFGVDHAASALLLICNLSPEPMGGF